MCILNAFEEGAAGGWVYNSPVRSVKIFGTQIFLVPYLVPNIFARLSALKTESLQPAAWQAFSICILLAAELVSSVPAKKSVAGRLVPVLRIPAAEPLTAAAVSGKHEIQLPFRSWSKNQHT
jgi:hypothetical protein